MDPEEFYRFVRRTTQFSARAFELKNGFGVDDKPLLQSCEFGQGLIWLDREIGQDPLFKKTELPLTLIASENYVCMRVFRNRWMTEEIEYFFNPSLPSEFRERVRAHAKNVASRWNLPATWMNNNIESYVDLHDNPTELFNDSVEQNYLIFDGSHIQVYAALWEWMLVRKLKRLQVYMDAVKGAIARGEQLPSTGLSLPFTGTLYSRTPSSPSSRGRDTDSQRQSPEYRGRSESRHSDSCWSTYADTPLTNASFADNLDSGCSAIEAPATGDLNATTGSRFLETGAAGQEIFDIGDFPDFSTDLLPVVTQTEVSSMHFLDSGILLDGDANRKRSRSPSLPPGTVDPLTLGMPELDFRATVSTRGLLKSAEEKHGPLTPFDVFDADMRRDANAEANEAGDGHPRPANRPRKRVCFALDDEEMEQDTAASVENGSPGKSAESSNGRKSKPTKRRFKSNWPFDIPLPSREQFIEERMKMTIGEVPARVKSTAGMLLPPLPPKCMELLYKPRPKNVKDESDLLKKLGPPPDLPFGPDKAEPKRRPALGIRAVSPPPESLAKLEKQLAEEAEDRKRRASAKSSGDTSPETSSKGGSKEKKPAPSQQTGEVRLAFRPSSAPRSTTSTASSPTSSDDRTSSSSARPVGVPHDQMPGMPISSPPLILPSRSPTPDGSRENCVSSVEDDSSAFDSSDEESPESEANGKDRWLSPSSSSISEAEDLVVVMEASVAQVDYLADDPDSSYPSHSSTSSEETSDGTSGVQSPEVHENYGWPNYDPRSRAPKPPAPIPNATRGPFCNFVDLTKPLSEVLITEPLPQLADRRTIDMPRAKPRNTHFRYQNQWVRPQMLKSPARRPNASGDLSDARLQAAMLRKLAADAGQPNDSHAVMTAPQDDLIDCVHLALCLDNKMPKGYSISGARMRAFDSARDPPLRRAVMTRLGEQCLKMWNYCPFKLDEYPE